uniref:Auxin response factor 1 n=1 Tax=Tanacetum cinerariifolium TaxID=118510 RepID=A0A6L2J2Y9_TANCI|nr:auxin response factor 1 [Tanacetum cinerariifolium]
MAHIAASNYRDGCVWLLLGAIMNIIGGSKKKKHHPQGFKSEFITKAPNKELWHQCYSCHAYVPREGEDVVYFPQGHLEQIEASDQQLPAILLPPKILCKVVNVQLWVEEDREQQGEVAIPDPPALEPPCCNVCSLYKTPTACDTSAPGGLRKHTYLSVLATTHHAFTTGTLFNVIYRPRATQYAFIISVNRYLKAQNPRPCVGMKFMIGFESERVPEERFSGTIVAVGDDASSKWPDSEWKSLKVQWDEPSPILPDGLSPWEIEVRPSRTLKWTCCCLQGLSNIWRGEEERSLVFLPAESLCGALGYVLPWDVGTKHEKAMWSVGLAFWGCVFEENVIDGALYRVLLRICKYCSIK